MIRLNRADRVNVSLISTMEIIQLFFYQESTDTSVAIYT